MVVSQIKLERALENFRIGYTDIYDILREKKALKNIIQTKYSRLNKIDNILSDLKPYSFPSYELYNNDFDSWYEAAKDKNRQMILFSDLTLKKVQLKNSIKNEYEKFRLNNLILNHKLHESEKASNFLDRIKAASATDKLDFQLKKENRETLDTILGNFNISNIKSNKVRKKKARKKYNRTYSDLDTKIKTLENNYSSMRNYYENKINYLEKETRTQARKIEALEHKVSKYSFFYSRIKEKIQPVRWFREKKANITSRIYSRLRNIGNYIVQKCENKLKKYAVPA